MAELKHCSRCETDKPLSEFYRAGNATLDRWCKNCRLAYWREWKTSNGEKEHSAQNGYHARHKDARNTRKRENRKRAASQSGQEGT